MARPSHQLSQSLLFLSRVPHNYSLSRPPYRRQKWKSVVPNVLQGRLCGSNSSGPKAGHCVNRLGPSSRPEVSQSKMFVRQKIRDQVLHRVLDLERLGLTPNPGRCRNLVFCPTKFFPSIIIVVSSRKLRNFQRQDQLLLKPCSASKIGD